MDGFHRIPSHGSVVPFLLLGVVVIVAGTIAVDQFIAAAKKPRSDGSEDHGLRRKNLLLATMAAVVFLGSPWIVGLFFE